MKIAITATEKKATAAIDPRFGRTKWFAIVDVDTKAIEFLSNEQNYQAQQGAGVQAAQFVCKQDVKAVITGHCGPKAFRALKAADVAVFLGQDMTVEEAIESYNQGALQESKRPDVSGHWA